MKATRLLITAPQPDLGTPCRRSAPPGFATSVIACGCEAGIERELSPAETPMAGPACRC